MVAARGERRNGRFAPQGIVEFTCVVSDNIINIVDDWLNLFVVLLLFFHWRRVWLSSRSSGKRFQWAIDRAFVSFGRKGRRRVIDGAECSREDPSKRSSFLTCSTIGNSRMNSNVVDHWASTSHHRPMRWRSNPKRCSLISLSSLALFYLNGLEQFLGDLPLLFVVVALTRCAQEEDLIRPIDQISQERVDMGQ